MSNAMVCPDINATTASLAALRPRGRAWRFGGSDDFAGSTMERFFRWMATDLTIANRRLCALLNERFCSTRVESTAEWMADYGLPDGCDPYAAICDKVNAVGDTTTDYAVAALARHGFTVSIVEEHTLDPEVSVTCDKSAYSGAMICGADDGVSWIVTIDRVASGIDLNEVFLAGESSASQPLGCEASLQFIECLLRRIMPAHADLLLN